MSWQDQTAGQRKRCILIDPETGDYVISGGRLQWDSTSVSQVYHAVMTARRSIPTSPEYGSTIHDQRKLIDEDLRKLESDTRAALKLLEDNQVIRAGTLRVVATASGLWTGSMTISWTDGGGQNQDLTVPIQPGFY